MQKGVSNTGAERDATTHCLFFLQKFSSKYKKTFRNEHQVDIEKEKLCKEKHE